jgi:hypothetical protein
MLFVLWVFMGYIIFPVISKGGNGVLQPIQMFMAVRFRMRWLMWQMGHSCVVVIVWFSVGGRGRRRRIGVL